ncbi:MAG TPA: SPOR domain-containing protein [Candidatus Polarisedimenticolia bacterium]|nr:SPOR domain-containing protein [Candidatus Polarisedimenticolia bacterium]
MEQEEVRPESAHEGTEKGVELQIGARHLTLAVTGLALFGLVLFLLGRWSERVAVGETPETKVESDASVPAGSLEAGAPKELTFYETLGKRATPPLQETRPRAPRSEPPAELPAAASAAAPSPAVPAPAASSTEPRGVERFRVQVASTRDLASARVLVDRLRKKGYPARIDSEAGGDGVSRYKVRIGNYEERAPAEELVQKVKQEEKVDAWIVKVQG